ncbi:MAG TPA: heme lyase CcmF/NrfE family subunit [Thermodesulfobacteriota bacterium]|nr:heme lyase CcmF/NrfE family subunit [Thermodesulfobacteriota bacterium]
MAETGSISIFLAFVISVYVLIASLVGGKTRRREFVRSAENGAFAVCFLLTVASLSLVHGLLTRDFSLRYVAMNTSTDLSTVYTITAFWAGQSGSLLLWAWILSIYMALAVLLGRRQNRESMPYVLVVLAAVSCFFTYLIGFVESPFEKLSFVPSNGNGLNPILQNPYMAIHPVTLYLGYVGITVPFAFAMGALLSGRLGDEWIRNSRKWMLFAWTFLSVGLLLGARWAYLELGWGGYWAWDPVENAAFMPWLVGTAFLHSVMIQEKKGMLKKWNMALIITTFFLSLFGTFITRSGIISSVHSFAQSDIGPFFLMFIGFVLIFSFAMFVLRLDNLKTENRYDSLLSRESAFLFNNLLFLGAAFSVFLGTIFPIVTEAIRGEKILVGPPYFNRVNVPIGLILILLMGVGPLISWRRASRENLTKNFLYPSVIGVLTMVALFAFGIREIFALISFGLCAFVVATVFTEFYRGARVRGRRGESYPAALFRLVSKNQRRYGGYIIHLGIVLIVVGITASSAFVTQKEATLKQGESVDVRGYTLRFEGLNQYTTDAKDAIAATLTLFNAGEKVGVMVPERNIYKYQGNREINQETEVALRSSFRDDLYVILSEFNGSGTATFRVLINPMVSWIWAGGVVLLLGAIITMWPSMRRQRKEAFAPYRVGVGGVGEEGAAKI